MFPAAIAAFVGVTAIETRTADVTVSVTPGEIMPPCVAVIVDVPGDKAVATPAALIVAVGVAAIVKLAFSY